MPYNVPAQAHCEGGEMEGKSAKPKIFSESRNPRIAGLRIDGRRLCPRSGETVYINAAPARDDGSPSVAQRRMATHHLYIHTPHPNLRIYR